MSFGKWLRENAEYQLITAAREEVGARYAVPKAPPERGLLPLFWRKVFVPAYRLLPWRWRLAIIRRMPGSHRKQWAPPPVRLPPGI